MTPHGGQNGTARWYALVDVLRKLEPSTRNPQRAAQRIEKEYHGATRKSGKLIEVRGDAHYLGQSIEATMRFGPPRATQPDGLPADYELRRAAANEKSTTIYSTTPSPRF